MFPRYHDCSPADLARLTGENVAELALALGRGPGAQTEITPYNTRCADPAIISPMFNGVVRSRIPPERAGEVIAETLDFFASRGRPLAFWWVGPGSEPADLGARLLAHGLAAFEVDAPSMAVDLHALPGAVGAPEGFTVEAVRDVAGAQLWGETFAAIYGVPPWAGQAWADSFARFGPERAPYRLYLGMLRGEAVATNILFCGAGVASVYGVGTLPAVRGRGIGAAITLQPYLDARALGYHTGVLFATEQGVPVYRRLGFRTVGAMSRYLWRAG
jgi:hypothetical protein